MASCEHQAHFRFARFIGFEQNNHVTVQTEDATIASRIVQPMDYSQKELGNECYWPVWTENEVERRQRR